MSDTALTPFSDKPDVTLDLRAAELSFLIYLLERGSMSARAHMESGSSNYALVCDRLLRKLTDLEGSTEERFDRAVAEIVKRG